MFKTIKAETVLRALELPLGFKIDRCLTRVTDYNTVEVEVKKKSGHVGKMQKTTRIEYNLTPEGMQKLASLSNHCSVKTINDFSKCMIVPLPVVYLFVVANDNLDIEVPDKHILVKYGYTNNLPRRTNEHVKTYGPGIFLKYHIYIDPVQLKSAEDEVRTFFKATSWHVNNSRFSELAIVPTSMMPAVISEYKRIGDSYMQKLSQLSLSNDLLRRELAHARELLSEKERAIGLALRCPP